MRTIILFVISFNFLITVHPQSNWDKEESNKSFSTLLSNNNIIGLSVGSCVNDKMIWKKNYGYRDLKQKLLFTDSTLTRIASISKTMTAIAIMQLFERELVDLDVPIQTYIPDFPIKKKGVITIRNLLTHSSGMGSYKSRAESESKREFKSTEAATNFFKNRSLEFTPNEMFHYTTYGYVLLGLVIEKVSGLSYELYMKKNIWDKAEMKKTGIEKFNFNYKNKSVLYRYNNKGVKRAEQNNLSNRAPGGGIHSNLNDMIKFGKAILNNSLIRKKTLDLMLTKHFMENKESSYGLGWSLYGSKLHENLIIGHSGEQTGANTQLIIIPKSKTVMVVLANTSGTREDISYLTWSLIETINKK